MVSSCSDPVIQKKIMRKDAWTLRRCSPCLTHARVRSLRLKVARRILKLWVFGEKGSMITSVHARVVVYMYLLFVMNGQNISNDSDKGVQICIGLAFIRPE